MLSSHLIVEDNNSVNTPGRQLEDPKETSILAVPSKLFQAQPWKNHGKQTIRRTDISDGLVNNLNNHVQKSMKAWLYFQE
ncbi:hypothetical protein J6590_029545 [Homalodisca vitripennis]|nr:hypothetical protein J6590_029545 [Homalodisca vitripennis]